MIIRPRSGVGMRLYLGAVDKRVHSYRILYQFSEAFLVPDPGVGSNDTSEKVKRLNRRVTAASQGRTSMNRLLIAAAASALAGSIALAQSTNQAVVRLDPALDALVSSDAKV